MWSWDIILALLAVGSAAGFIAGLFGVGGGTLIVPVVLWALRLQGIGGHPYAQHLAIGTSFAIMVFTTFSSMYAQHKKHAIDWATVRRMTPGMILGVLLGAVSAKYMPTLALQVFFYCISCLYRTQNPTRFQTQTFTHPTCPPRPDSRRHAFWCGFKLGRYRRRFAIRSISAVLQLSGTPRHRHIFRFGIGPISIAGTIGYFANGLHIANLPEGAAGFIYLPAMAILSVATILFAPLGVKTAHKLPARNIKSPSAFMLLLIAAKWLGI